MGQDKLTRVRIRGMRTLADVELDLTRGLTVLIGDNGSGKSTIVEAFELLRQVPRPGQYLVDVVGGFHGGIPALLRQGDRRVGLSVDTHSPNCDLHYEYAFGPFSNALEVQAEQLARATVDNGTESLHPSIMRAAANCFVLDSQMADRQVSSLDMASLAIASYSVRAQWQAEMLGALDHIEVHPWLDTRCTWLLANQQQPLANARAPQQVQPTECLDRTGANLMSCLQALRNDRETWERVLMRARAGVSDDLRDIGIEVTARGQAEVTVTFGSMPEPLPLSSLSEGQIAYLCFIVIAEMGASRSAVVIDEPESHLHPALVPRVAWMLEHLAKTTPVVVATHSDSFLDSLTTPAEAVVLCSLDEQGATRLRRPDPAGLAQWLKNYRGIGELRSEGYEPHVFHEPSRRSGGASC